MLAALALLIGPYPLRTGALFQPVVFEALWWSLAALAFVALLDGGDRRWWLLFGVAAGLGGLTKFSAAIFGAAMAVGVLFSPLRRDLLTRWPWVAVLVGGLIALPAVLGQIAWGWPFFAQAQVLRESQLERVTAGSFLAGQLFLEGAAAPLLLVGAAGLFASRGLRPFRGLGVAAGAALVFLLVLGGKEYYFGPMHLPLLAAGSVVAGAWLATRPRLWRGALALGVVGGLLLLPLGIPLLPPAEERADAVIVGGNYGRAGAPLCGEVVQAGQITTPMGVEEEQDVPVHVCRGLKEPLSRLWRELGPAWG
ncbi:MAG: glycosyltransferase family 39 protein [Longimicrobiales bacterium]|nr:glycosyltransferase family 39 protein [Longimicrobiales bacterium]